MLRIDVSEFWKDENLALSERAKKISERFQLHKHQLAKRNIDLGDIKDELEELGDEFGGDVETFDYIWSKVYDWADENGVWIETRK